MKPLHDILPEVMTDLASRRKDNLMLNNNTIRSTVGNAANTCKNVIAHNILKKDEAEIDLLERVKEQIQDSEGKLVIVVDVATGRSNIFGTPEALEEASKHEGIHIEFDSLTNE